MFGESFILPKQMLEAKKAKRVAKKKTGTAQSAAKRSRSKTARSRST